MFLADLKKSEEGLKLSRNKGSHVLDPTEDLNMTGPQRLSIGSPMKPREMNSGLNESKGRISLT